VMKCPVERHSGRRHPLKQLLTHVDVGKDLYFPTPL
jgi:hypothetical protein